MDIKEEPLDPLQLSSSFDDINNRLENKFNYVTIVSPQYIKTDIIGCGPVKEEASIADNVVPKIKSEYNSQTANQSNGFNWQSRIDNCNDSTEDIAEESEQISDDVQTFSPCYEVPIEKNNVKIEINILEKESCSNEDRQMIQTKEQFESSNIIVPDLNQTGISNSLFKCGVCAFEHKELSELKRHESVHNIEKVYVEVDAIVKKKRKPRVKADAAVKKKEQKTYDISVNDNGEKKYKCKECSFETKHVSSIYNHRSTHNKSFKCPLCPFVTQRKQELREHKLFSHSIVYSNEMQLDSVCRQPPTENKNKPIDPDKNKYICDICSRRFSVRRYFNEHKLTHSNEKPFKCLSCPYATIKRRYLNMHNIRKHSSVKPYNCDICPYGSPDLPSMKIHRRIHFPEKPYKCPLCDYSTVQSQKLKVHSLTHTKLKPCKCDLCPLSFRLPYDLKLHKLKKHTLAKPFACDVCSFTACTLSELKIHKLNTHKESNGGEIDDSIELFQCDQCPYVSNLNGNLKVHQVTHSTEKPYLCEMCPFRSKQLMSLKLHMKKHTHERKFKCDLCPYASINLMGLNLHKMTHDPVKPFKCDLCDFTAVQKPKLKIHRTVHFNEKNEKCNLCPFTCKQPANLRMHKLRRHDGEKPYVCEVCSYKCIHLWQLKKHNKKNH